MRTRLSHRVLQLLSPTMWIVAPVPNLVCLTCKAPMLNFWREFESELGSGHHTQDRCTRECSVDKEACSSSTVFLPTRMCVCTCFFRLQAGRTTKPRYRSSPDVVATTMRPSRNIIRWGAILLLCVALCTHVVRRMHIALRQMSA